MLMVTSQPRTCWRKQKQSLGREAVEPASDDGSAYLGLADAQNAARLFLGEAALLDDVVDMDRQHGLGHVSVGVLDLQVGEYVAAVLADAVFGRDVVAAWSWHSLLLGVDLDGGSLAVEAASSCLAFDYPFIWG